MAIQLFIYFISKRRWTSPHLWVIYWFTRQRKGKETRDPEPIGKQRDVQRLTNNPKMRND